MLTLNDQLLLEQKGISEEKVNNQLNHFRNGFPFMQIERPATVGDGIIAYNNAQMAIASDLYDSEIRQGMKVLKFVPASGAATRMFKSLFDALSQLENEGNALLNKDVKLFFDNIDKFPFFKDLEKRCGFALNPPIDVQAHGAQVLRKFLVAEGLNYGSLPKGVLKFHLNKEAAITPIEEHLLEGALYGKDGENHVHIHFTVSNEHEGLFKKIVSEKKHLYEERFNVTYKISFSQQKPSTDTVAVTPDNEIFRQDNGDMLFRPAGHGALIENLNDLNSDIVFIKNIDNVVPEHFVNDTVQFKKVLAGTLVNVRESVFKVLNKLQTYKLDEELLTVVTELETNHHIVVPTSIKRFRGEMLQTALHQFLNRPIRVCGMVRNEGEPGGGPFWVKDQQGNLSLQIVESSQIDMNDPVSVEILKSSTHFNPVDLVCSIRNYKGHKFDLSLYVDPDTGFVSEKSLNGKPLRALELPGLWNGAMSHWITIFVEVPLTTFNPVKTVNDLLRPQHQPVG